MHRALVAPAFRGKALEEKFGPTIRRELPASSSTRSARTARVDLVDAFAHPFPINVIVDMLGLPTKRPRPLPALVHRRSWASSGTSPATQAVAAAGLRTNDELEQYMIPAIRAPPGEPGDDLLSTLCAAEIDGESMTDEEIKAFCSLLLTAGGETTDKAVTEPDGQPRRPPRAARGGARRPLPDPRRVRRDAALVAAGAHDHAPARGGRGALGRDRRGGPHGHVPHRRGQPRRRAGSTGPRSSTSCAPTSTTRAPSPPRPTTSRSASDATSASGPCCRCSRSRSGSTTSSTR